MQKGRLFRYKNLAAAAALGPILLACGPARSPAENAADAAESQAAARTTWTDPATHLTWAAKDNGYPVTWEMAKTFCSNLTTAGYKWTLPTIEQLESVYYVGENDFGHPVKGNIKLTADYEWSSSAKGSGEAWVFHFAGGSRASHDVGSYGDTRALCVRRAGE